MAYKRKIRRHRVIINNRPIKAEKEKKPGLHERHFWILAFGVILISIFTRVFDFSLMPLSYKGLFITRPYYGLHSWGSANRAWNARSHVKYGLGYTKGYRTLVVGDPPPAHPQRYVSHPSLKTLINAFGMLLLGSQEWQVRLFDLILSIPVLLLILFLLRKLYGCGCALLSCLLLVSLPLSAYFGFKPLMTLIGLWALWRYLLLTGQIGDGHKPKRRHFLELTVALFLMVQLGWAGVFYAFAIGLPELLCHNLAVAKINLNAKLWRLAELQCYAEPTRR